MPSNTTATVDEYRFWSDEWSAPIPKEQYAGFADGKKAGRQEIIDEIKDYILDMPDGDHFVLELYSMLKNLEA